MIPALGRKALAISVSGLILLLPAGCAVTDGGYGYDGNVNAGVDYYDPWFSDYGGWGPDYRVGPPRYRMRQPGFGVGHRSPLGHAPPPGGRQIPSIPSQPHGGGGGRPRR